MKHFDAVVVGCGAMGSSIGYNLASRGLSVLVLEKFELNHEFGSSHGRTRIIRLAYFEDPRYVPLLRRAYDSWRELSAKSGREVIIRTGGLMIGLGDGNFVSGVLRSAEEYSLPHRLLDASEVTTNFGAFRLEEGYSAVHDESAGVLFPEECISAYVDLARADGCEFRFSERVNRWGKTANGIEVETEKGRYAADGVVFAAGPWTPSLLGEMVPLKIERQVPFWFGPLGNQTFSARRMPVFIMEESPGHYFYGIPDTGHGAKVARHHEGDFVGPDYVIRDVTDKDLSPVKGFVGRRLPELDPNPLSSTTCLYSNTPDFDFVIDLLPDDKRVVVVSACSGTGSSFPVWSGRSPRTCFWTGGLPTIYPS